MRADLRVQCDPGESVEDAAREVIARRRQLEMPFPVTVRFICNHVEVRLQPGDSARDVQLRWRALTVRPAKEGSS